MLHPHYYKHLDKDSKIRVELDLRDVAERIEAMNYGVHRFLSHLIDVRRAALAERIARYKAEGKLDVALYAQSEGDELADRLEALLNEGLF